MPYMFARSRHRLCMLYHKQHSCGWHVTDYLRVLILSIHANILLVWHAVCPLAELICGGATRHAHDMSMHPLQLAGMHVSQLCGWSVDFPILFLSLIGVASWSARFQNACHCTLLVAAYLLTSMHATWLHHTVPMPTAYIPNSLQYMCDFSNPEYEQQWQ